MWRWAHRAGGVSRCVRCEPLLSKYSATVTRFQAVQVVTVSNLKCEISVSSSVLSLKSALFTTGPRVLVCW